MPPPSPRERSLRLLTTEDILRGSLAETRRSHPKPLSVGQGSERVICDGSGTSVWRGMAARVGFGPDHLLWILQLTETTLP